jgi:hypothetical protein
LSSSQNEHITRAIVEMVVLDYMPLKLVEGKGFLNLMSILAPIFASQGLRFWSPFSPPLADLEYILRIHALIFHWLRLPVHVSNQKMFYTEHMLSTKCKQRCHFPFWFQ